MQIYASILVLGLFGCQREQNSQLAQPGFYLNQHQKGFEFIHGITGDTTFGRYDAMENSHCIKIPAQYFFMGSNTFLPLLTLMGQEERVKGIVDAHFINNPYWDSLVEAGSILNIGSGCELDRELMLQFPNAVVLGNMELFSRNAWLKSSTHPLISIEEYLESSPLKAMEWARVIGAVLGRGNFVDSLCRLSENNYSAIALSIKKNIKKPKIMAGQYYEGYWLIPGGDSYIAHLIRDAGGEYVFSDLKGSGASKVDAEFILSRMPGVTYFRTIDFQQQPIHSRQDWAKFHPEMHRIISPEVSILCSNTKYQDVFGVGILRPDEMLLELYEIFNGKAETSTQRYFTPLSN